MSVLLLLFPMAILFLWLMDAFDKLETMERNQDGNSTSPSPARNDSPRDS